MKALNLDPDFKPFRIECLGFKSLVFPGGEPHIKIDTLQSPDDGVIITHRVCCFNDLGLILMAVDALKRMGIPKIQLFLPYFPGARQDRVVIAGEPLSVKVYASLLNQLQLDKVIIFDAHSDVAPALIDNVWNISNGAFAQKVAAQLPEDFVLVAPDGGSLKKIYNTAQILGNREVVICSKHRNAATGMLDRFQVYETDLQHRPCVIIDDICDGGRTFVGLAKALTEKNAGPLFLVVSHGIFSQGLEVLTPYFDKIFTTDSFKNISGPKLVQFPLSSLNIYL